MLRHCLTRQYSLEKFVHAVDELLHITTLCLDDEYLAMKMDLVIVCPPEMCVIIVNLHLRIPSRTMDRFQAFFKTVRHLDGIVVRIVSMRLLGILDIRELPVYLEEPIC